MPSELTWHPVALAIVLAVTALAVMRPSDALIAWVWITALITQPLLRVRSSTVQVGTVILCALLLVTFLRQRQFLWQRLRGSPLRWPLLALMVAALFAGVQGEIFYDPLVAGVHRQTLIQIYAVMLIVLSAAAAMLVAALLQSSDDLRLLWWALVGVGACAVGASILPRVQVHQWNPFVAALAAALVGARLLYATPISLIGRMASWGLIAVVVIEFVAIQFLQSGSPQQWISGWIAVCVPLGWLVLGWLRWPARVAAGAAVVVAAVAMTPRIWGVFEQAGREGDFGRLTLWRDAFGFLSMRPLFGVGPGNYSDYVEAYSQAPFGSAHGNYQQVAGEMGIVGLLVMLWLTWRAAGVAMQACRASSDAFVQSLTRGLTAWLIGMASAAVLGDYLLPSYHNGGHANFAITVYVWIALGALMAVAAAKVVDSGGLGVRGGTAGIREKHILQ